MQNVHRGSRPPRGFRPGRNAWGTNGRSDAVLQFWVGEQLHQGVQDRNLARSELGDGQMETDVVLSREVARDACASGDLPQGTLLETAAPSADRSLKPALRDAAHDAIWTGASSAARESQLTDSASPPA